MHSPTQEERNGFARTTAKAQGLTVRAVRKARQKTGAKGVPMPHAMPNHEKEVQFIPIWDKSDKNRKHTYGVPQ